jgi:hypothetical protein
MHLWNDVRLSLIHPFFKFLVHSHLVELVQQQFNLMVLSIGLFLQVIMGPILWFKYGKECEDNNTYEAAFRFLQPYAIHSWFPVKHLQQRDSPGWNLHLTCNVRKSE